MADGVLHMIEGSCSGMGSRALGGVVILQEY